MAQLDLEWIAVFDEVYKTASVSHAAERLGLAQSAASTALNRLRAHFDDRLFSRTARGMLPTPRAEALYPSLRAVLEHLQAARAGSRGGFDAAETTRRFRICMTDISEIVVLPALLNHLGSASPGVEIEVEKISSDSARRLEEGDVDLAVGFMPQLDAGFYQQSLFMQKFVCLVGAAHPRIGARLGKAAYAGEKHVVVTTSGTGHAIVDKLLAREGVERRIVLRVPSFLSVARIVAETDLIATVPVRYGEVMQAREPIRLLAVPHPLPGYAVKQHWHERFHADAGNAWLRRTLVQVMGTSRTEASAVRG